MLLTRDEFREQVFKRSDGKCVVCQQPAKDAHHIMERRLWPDGGYYLDNGAALCETCHLKAESTDISCNELRQLLSITRVHLPPHLYDDQEYDKWANPILPNGTRLRGELFNDESVQKVLAPVLTLFTNRVKYPRTYHLPWSENLTKDDRMMEDYTNFEGKEVVATIKMDGENTTMYRDYIHARSITHEPHESRNYVKVLHASIAHEIPENWRLCGENLYAKHSIKYTDLPSYFLLFSVWDANNICLSWEETCEWALLLGLQTVHPFYVGQFQKSTIHETFLKHRNGEQEGYVIRDAGSFNYGSFRNMVGKFVRKGHVHTHGHWMRQKIEPNGLKK